MRYKVLSFALGAGLMAASVGPVFADHDGSNHPDVGTGLGGRPMTRAETIKAILDFCAATQKSWSIEGYSSVASERETEGNNLSDWVNTTAKMLGVSPSSATICTQVAGLAAPSTTTTTTQGGGGGTTGSGGTGSGGTSTGTTPGGTSTGTGTTPGGTGTGTGQGGGAATGGGESPKP